MNKTRVSAYIFGIGNLHGGRVFLSQTPQEIAFEVPDRNPTSENPAETRFGLLVAWAYNQVSAVIGTSDTPPARGCDGH